MITHDNCIYLPQKKDNAYIHSCTYVENGDFFDSENLMLNNYYILHAVIPLEINMVCGIKMA